MNILKFVTFFAIALSATILPAKEKKLELPVNAKLIQVKSASMNKDIEAIVVLPEGYEKNQDKRYPVIYLLHGYGGNHTSWILKTKPDLHNVASKTNIIFVCPNGDNKWYVDSPVHPEIKYETFVAKELVEYIDKNYRTIASKEGRAITGYSMGGHGALLLCLKHQDTFGAAGSMAGTVDLRMNVNQGKIDVLGEYSKYRSVWDENSVINNLHRVHRKSIPAFIIDCGTEDHLIRANEKLHQEMLDMRLPHEYITRPGGHTQPYWRNAIDTQIMFFSKYFSKQ